MWPDMALKVILVNDVDFGRSTKCSKSGYARTHTWNKESVSSSLKPQLVNVDDTRPKAHFVAVIYRYG